MSAEKRRALAGRIMKLLSIVAAMLMYPVLSKDEVHHLRGEQEQANQDAIGVPEKELADTKGRGDAPQADEVGVPTEEVKAKSRRLRRARRARAIGGQVG